MDKKIVLYCEENYTDKEMDKILYSVAFIFIQKYFLKTTLSNLLYEKNVFRILKKIMAKKLLDISKQTEGFCQELSLYLFKKYFKQLFSLIAQLLLKEVAYSNQDIINFLKYYSLDTIVIQGIKYKVPQLKEKDGPRWNVTAMMGILKTYIKTQDYLKNAEKEILKIQKNLEEFHVNGITPKEHNDKITLRYSLLEKEILTNSKQINILRDSINIEKNEEVTLNLIGELTLSEEKRLTLRETKSKLLQLKVKQIKLLQYDELLNKIEANKHNTKAHYKILTTNQASYESLKNSLIIALISKKEEI